MLCEEWNHFLSGFFRNWLLFMHMLLTLHNRPFERIQVLGFFRFGFTLRTWWQRPFLNAAIIIFVNSETEFTTNNFFPPQSSVAFKRVLIELVNIRLMVRGDMAGNQRDLLYRIWGNSFYTHKLRDLPGQRWSTATYVIIRRFKKDSVRRRSWRKDSQVKLNSSCLILRRSNQFLWTNRAGEKPQQSGLFCWRQMVATGFFGVVH